MYVRVSHQATIIAGVANQPRLMLWQMCILQGYVSQSLPYQFCFRVVSLAGRYKGREYK